MKAFIASVIGFTGASLYQSRSDAQAWGWASKPAFSQEKFQSYKLMQIEEVSHDTKHFRFALASARTPLDIPVASCITLRYTDGSGQEVARPYTPVNLVGEEGHFDLVVKCYPNSKMGTHLFSLKVGDSIEAKGPWHTFDLKPNQYAQIGMLAGGTGITPMYQVAANVLRYPENNTTISLLFANKTDKDIIMKDQLDALVHEFIGKFAVHHCLGQAPKRWAGHTGYVNKEMIQETMPAPKHPGGSVVLVSGPPPFMDAISGPKDYKNYPPKQGELKGYLKELGYTEADVYKF